MKTHPDAVREIRYWHGHGYGVTAIADAYGLSRQAVTNIVKYRTYPNVTQDPSVPPLMQVDRAVKMVRARGRPMERKSKLEKALEQRSYGPSGKA